MGTKVNAEKIQLIIEGIVAGHSHDAIAQTAGVSRQTISLYSRKPEIKAEIDRRKAEAIAPKVEAYEQINRTREAESRKWVQAMTAHNEDMLKSAKTFRIGGMNVITRALNAIAKINIEDAKLSEIVSLLRVGHEIATSSYELEADALGIYELMERVNEHSKELEG